MMILILALSFVASAMLCYGLLLFGAGFLSQIERRARVRARVRYFSL